MWGNTILFHMAKSIRKIILRKDTYWQKLLIEKSKYLHNQIRKAF